MREIDAFCHPFPPVAGYATAAMKPDEEEEEHFRKRKKKNKQTKEEKEDGEKRHADFPTRSLNPTPGTNIEAPRVKSVLRQTWTPHLISLLLLLP